MKYKHIEASREARLWLSQVVVPVAIGTAMVFGDREKREWITAKANDVKESFRGKFTR